MAGSISRTDPYNITVAERRIRALELRKMGLTFRDIVNTIRQEFGENCPESYDERHAWNDVNNRLTEMGKIAGETANQVLQIELQRLDAMFMIAYNQVLQGNIKAIPHVLEIMKRRSRYLGLDKPLKYEVNTWQNEIISLIQSGKITIGQVRQELGDELTQRLLESGSISFPEGGAVTPESNIIEGEFVAGAEHSRREQSADPIPQSSGVDVG